MSGTTHEEPESEPTEPRGWRRVHGWLSYVNNILLLPMFTVMVIEAMEGQDIGYFASINEFFCIMFLLEWALGLALADNRLVTLSTVGYGDVTPTSAAGHVVAAFVIFAGVGVFGYMAGFMTSLLEDPEEDEILATVKRLEEQLGALQVALTSGQIEE